MAQSILVPFEGLSSLFGFRSSEPYVDHNVFCIASTIFIPMLIFIALGLSIGVAYFRGACLAVVSVVVVFSRQMS